MATPRRASFIMVNMAARPRCGSPTSQPWARIEIHHAGGRGLDAHLVLDGAAGHAVARARPAVVGGQEFRHEEQRNAARAGGRVGQFGEHEVEDVVGEVLLAAGDEDFRAGDAVAAVAGRLGAGADEAEIGAALRLGQAHRAGPFAADQFGQIAVAQLLRAVLAARPRRRHGTGRDTCRRRGWTSRSFPAPARRCCWAGPDRHSRGRSRARSSRLRKRRDRLAGKPLGVRTTPFSKRQPSSSPLRLSGNSTSAQNVPAASSTGSIASGDKSSQPGKARRAAVSDISYSANCMSRKGA